jgi:hypothetical protein
MFNICILQNDEVVSDQNMACEIFLQIFLSNSLNSKIDINFNFDHCESLAQDFCKSCKIKKSYNLARFF